MSMSHSTSRTARGRFVTAAVVSSTAFMSLIAVPSTMAATKSPTTPSPARVATAAPIINSTGSISISQTQTNVTANVSVFGEDATIKVDFGTTSALGSSRTESYDPPAATGTYVTYEELTGLTPGTVYFYRYTVTTSQGTAVSATKQFVTAAAPVINSTNSISIGQTQTNVAANVNVFGKAATIKVDYGTTSSFGFSKTESYNPGTQTGAYVTYEELTGLTPGTVYYYRYTVTTSQGTAVSATKQFVTAAAPVINSTSSISISPAQTNVVANVNVFGKNATIRVDYDTTGSFGFSKTESYAPGAAVATYVTYDELKGLTPGATYYYRYTVTTSEGTAVSATKQFTTAT